MSTSGKYGERQSWRRAGSGEAGKRRTIKAVLTAIAAALILLFLYIIFAPKPDQHLVAVLVSNEYDTSIVTPPLFGENVRANVAEQLGAIELNKETAAVVRSTFRELKGIDQDSDGKPDLNLDDPDDTLMVILRGYLMQTGAGDPALACSDLGIGPSPDQPSGLLALSEILQPLIESMPDSFQGTRLVVLDVEPLAAHPALGQWNDQAFGKLDQMVAGLSGETAGRLWVLVTRGPMQNVGWDASTQMPISTQLLLDGLDGKADLDRDTKVDLRELCAFMADRYQRLPSKQREAAPGLMLLRGGVGIVGQDAVSRGDLDVWITRAQPKPDPEDDEQEGTPDEPGEVADDLAEKISFLKPVDLQLTPVVFQATPGESEQGQSEQGQSDAEQPAASGGAADQDSSPGQDAGKPGAAASGDGAAAGSNQSGDNGSASSAAGEVTFWDLRDQFESIPLSASGEDQTLSAIALAPHLWRQLIVKVLGAEIKNLDSKSPILIAEQVKRDLEKLLEAAKGQEAGQNVNDNFVKDLYKLIGLQRARRQSVRSDRRLQTADALQHAIAAARMRIWAHLEFQRQAAICGAQVPVHNLLNPTLDAERILASGRGTETPGPGVLSRELAKLHTAINLFDRNVNDAVKQLLESFARAEPAQAWEVSRNAWAWIRSPLPTGQQRAQITAAIEGSPLATEEVAESEVNVSSIPFASPTAEPANIGLTDNLRYALSEYRRSARAGQNAEDEMVWKQELEQKNGEPESFAKLFDAALRIDPRINVEPLEPMPLAHAIEPLPLVRNPTVNLVGEGGETLDDAAILRMETMQDVRSVELDLNPDRDQPTRLLITFRVRSSAGDFGPAPVGVRWKIPGAGEIRAGESLPVTVKSDSTRRLPLEIKPLELAESVDDVVLEIQVRGDRESDNVKGVVGTYELPIELPRENRLRVVASSYRGIGCSKEVVSGESGLPGGLWLRTFNNRKTPFKLQVFNESGKPCMAQVWLIKLPNPMPDYAGYWPDFAASKYSNPEGGVLNGDGRIFPRFLRDDRVLKGPSTISIPADKQRVPLSFTPPATPDGSAPPVTPASGGASEQDLTHGMAVVCRLVDAEGNVMPEKDQVIYLVAKPWAPQDYVTTKTTYRDGEVEIDLQLRTRIDGDDQIDRLPEIEKQPVRVQWVEDDQWVDFVPGSEEPSRILGAVLNPQAGKSSNYFRVPVVRRNVETWVRLDVDGWPRAIGQLLDHQQGAVGQPRFRNEVRFGALALTREPTGDRSTAGTVDDPSATKTYFAPEGDTYFVGNGKQLIATLKADFTIAAFKHSAKPEVRLEVEGKRDRVFQTDRMIKTTAVEIKDEGVVTLLTSVTDLQAELNQGQRSDSQIPIVATLFVDNEVAAESSITAVLDSTAPPADSILIEPRKFGPYYAPRSVAFTISANDFGDRRRPPSGIARIEVGLDTKGDGKADTQRIVETFDPPQTSAVMPVSKSSFKFQQAGDFGIVVRAIDACGNEASRSFEIAIEKKPEMTAEGGDQAAKPKTGRLHGRIDTRASFRGTLSLSPAPKPVNTREVDITPTDKSFDFGPLPEGQYTLKFKGTNAGQSIDPLEWKELEIDTTPDKSKPLYLDPSDAETEE